MPEPSSGTDIYIYDALKKVAPRLCWLSPNVVTVLGGLCVFPILYILKTKGGLFAFLLVAMFRQLLDCLDGVIARRCDLQSVLGAKLDFYADVAYHFIIGIYLLRNIFLSTKAPKSLKVVSFTIILLVMCGFVYGNMYTYNSSNKAMQPTRGDRFIQASHDNSVVVSMLLSCLIYYVNLQL